VLSTNTTLESSTILHLINSSLHIALHAHIDHHMALDEASPQPGGVTMTPPCDRRNEFKRSGRRLRFSYAVPTTKEENDFVKERHVTDENPHPWQCCLLAILNSPTVQHIIIAMLLLDVSVIFTELAIDAFFPSCNLIERDAVSCCSADEGGDPHAAAAGEAHRFMAGTVRLLAEGGSDGHHYDLCQAPLVMTGNPAGCNDHKYPGVHVAHTVLFSLTLIILILFEIELLMMIYLLGPRKYFSRMLYALDLFVVTVSLVLEITFRVVDQDILHDLVGILIVFRLWRFVRIGHGLVASTFELQEEKVHELKHYVEEVEKMVENYGGELPKERPSLLKESTSGH
jgi:hypothetical protein